MLILKVRDGERVLIGDDVVVVATRGKGKHTNLHFEAPADLAVRRAPTSTAAAPPPTPASAVAEEGVPA